MLLRAFPQHVSIGKASLAFIFSSSPHATDDTKKLKPSTNRNSVELSDRKLSFPSHFFYRIRMW